MCINGKGIHSNGYEMIAKEISRGYDFYIVELVNVTGAALSLETPMSAMYKMIARMMLQNGFEPSFGLGRNSQGIVEPILVPIKEARYGLGYIPTDDDMNTKKKNDQALTKPIPHLYQSLPISEYDEYDDLEEGICGISRRST